MNPRRNVNVISFRSGKCSIQNVKNTKTNKVSESDSRPIILDDPDQNSESPPNTKETTVDLDKKGVILTKRRKSIDITSVASIDPHNQTLIDLTNVTSIDRPYQKPISIQSLVNLK